MINTQQQDGVFFNKLNAPLLEFDEFFFPQASLTNSEEHRICNRISWIVDAINENILPLPGHVGEHGVTPVEQLRRAKHGV